MWMRILMLMSRRLQVLLDEREFDQWKRLARRQRITLGEWVRRALRRAASSSAGVDPAMRLQALDEALRCGHPTGGIDEMLAEIERGRALR
jgi:predicted amidophosphoribosyltransferase